MNSLNLWLSGIDREIYQLRLLGLSSLAIKKRLQKKFKDRLLLNPGQTSNFHKMFRFVVCDESIGNMKFYK
jgi:hypothetical protein